MARKITNHWIALADGTILTSQPWKSQCRCLTSMIMKALVRSIWQVNEVKISSIITTCTIKIALASLWPHWNWCLTSSRLAWKRSKVLRSSKRRYLVKEPYLINIGTQARLLRRASTLSRWPMRARIGVAVTRDQWCERHCWVTSEWLTPPCLGVRCISLEILIRRSRSIWLSWRRTTWRLTMSRRWRDSRPSSPRWCPSIATKPVVYQTL